MSQILNAAVSATPSLIQPGVYSDIPFRICNTTGGTIYMGNDDTLTPATGWPITPGSSFEIDARNDLYVVASVPGTVIYTNA